MTALCCHDLDAGYAGGRPVLRGFGLSLEPGEVVALLGPNGAGKTTLLLTLSGLLPSLGGGVELRGRRLAAGQPREASRQGVVLVPDDRSLFTGLSTRDNLILAGRRRGSSLGAVLDYFPALTKRLNVAAGQLSGGEQQMLAIGRALMQEPKVLLIDELSMGLAPVIVEALLPVVRQVASDTGAAVLFVEQHVRMALEVADRAVVLAHGETVLEGAAAALAGDPETLERAYLGDAHVAAS